MRNKDEICPVVAWARFLPVEIRVVEHKISTIYQQKKLNWIRLSVIVVIFLGKNECQE